jgi:hypothetical protein
MEVVLVKIGVFVGIVILVTLIRVMIFAIRKGLRKPSPALSPLPPPPSPPKPVPVPAPAPAATGKAVLRGISGVYQGADVPFDGKPIVLGRDPSAANLVFPSDTRGVSSRHCIVKYENSRFYVEDCWSTNGTFLSGGKAVAPGQPVEVKPGTRFYLGDQANTFEVAMTH